MTRDFISAWVFPVAIVLPPVYAMVTTFALQVVTRLWVNKGIWHRRVFASAAMSLSYGGASLTYRAFPASVTAGVKGHYVLAWAAAVVVCEIVGGRGHHILLLAAIKLSDRSVRLKDLVLNRESLQADLAESDLGILIALTVGINVGLAIVAVPTVLLIRRFIMHEQLLAQARTDTKTGLLNASTWEAEAVVEVTRAVRTAAPVSLLLIDIDHFKRVNDTYGHLVGDTALRAVTDAIREQLRSYDLAGRFGGEEFVVLLPNAREADAMHIAERLRRHIASLRISAGGDESARISLTVSVGVSSLTDPAQGLSDLMAAADGAMYHAKQTGRNKTCVVRPAVSVSLAPPPPSPAGAGAKTVHH